MKVKFYFEIFITSLFLLFVQSCEKIDGANTPEVTESPYIKLVDISPLKINTDSLNLQSVKNPEDTVNLKINFTLTEENSNDETLLIKFFKYELSNIDEAFKDYSGEVTTTKTTLANNKGYLHSGTISVAIRRQDIGNYSFKLYGIDSKNRTSNSIVTNIIVIRENHSPVIENVIAPDTINISEGTQKYTFIAKVSDLEGLSDIKKVFFNSFKPDGTGATGNPFQMFDDGNKTGTSGDDTANDGSYSLTIQITQQNPKGKYRFDFYATDKSDSTSKVYSHYIVVQ
jgi:hypothetical protein